MKRILGLLICVVLVLSYASCKGKGNKTDDPKPSDPIETNNEYNDPSGFVDSDNVIDTTTLKIYDGPEYLTQSSKAKVKVNGNSLFVYETRVNHDRQFSWMQPTDTVPVVIFDFEGKVSVEVEVEENVSSAVVRPLMYGIAPTLQSKKITFDLEYPGNYVVEYNDDPAKAIHIFANPLEENPLSASDASDDVIYIGPGVYKADAIPVKDNVTIYLAGGAYVYGQVRAEGMKNVTIRGRGIISGSIYNRRSESEYTIPIEMRYCDNVKIEGITILDPAGWTVALYKSKNIEIDNLKIITARQNGDGISVQSCENVTIKGGFVRSWDDSLVVKNVDGASTKNITFDGCVVWTDLAQSMEVGYEANGETMDEITFNNIIVVHNFHKAVISMHDADDAKITNVKYTNITVEDCQTLGDNRNDNENDFLIDLCVLYNQDWSKSTNIKGSVNGVTIENVRVYKILDSIISRVNGYSPTATISNVVIKNVDVAGKMATSASDLGLVTNQYTSNINVTSDQAATGAKIELPYKLDLKSNEITVERVENINQEGMIVPDFARSKGDLPYIGVAIASTYTASATHSAGTKTTTPADDGSGDFSRAGTNAANSIDGKLDTVWKSADWKDQENEFAALTIDFDELINVGVIRILGNPNNEFYYTYSFQIYGRKVKTDGSISDYIRLLSLKDYAMTPGSNNCIDVNITTQDYKGLQIRFYKTNYDSSPASYEVSEVQFFAPSLSYNKPIVASTPHNDVYNVEKLVDGDATGTSYYESAELPATIVIDLGDVYNLSAIVLCLPPSLKWDARSEEIEIFVSSSTQSYSQETSFEQLVAKTSYLFDPQTGNRNIINLDGTKTARFIKVVIYSNDIRAGYNAQLSEISVYGN